jgi:3-deoxy-D-manno-octulosonate 8-phosphate phosphatase (KDO 8-P phosphatase)
MIKLLILDVDGVMTNGKKIYDKDGNIVGKEFCDKDWTAIKRFKALNIDVVFLSGDKFNEKIAKNRNIPFWHNISPKEDYLDEICKAFYAVSTYNVAYVGDDLFDINIANLVKYPYCPLDAIVEMKDICKIIPSNGGNNVIMNLFNMLSSSKLIPQWNSSHINILNKLDSQEVKHV